MVLNDQNHSDNKRLSAADSLIWLHYQASTQNIDLCKAQWGKRNRFRSGIGYHNTTYIITTKI